jgi:hypothetical protein
MGVRMIFKSRDLVGEPGFFKESGLWYEETTLETGGGDGALQGV